MRLYLVQSKYSGAFLVPEDGYIGWTSSLRYALSCGLVDKETAQQLILDHCDSAEIIFIRNSQNHEY